MGRWFSRLWAASGKHPAPLAYLSAFRHRTLGKQKNWMRRKVHLPEHGSSISSLGIQFSCHQPHVSLTASLALSIKSLDDRDIYSGWRPLPLGGLSCWMASIFPPFREVIENKCQDQKGRWARQVLDRETP